MVQEADFDRKGRISFENFKMLMRGDDISRAVSRRGSTMSPGLKRLPSRKLSPKLRSSSMSAKLPVELNDRAVQLGMPSPLMKTGRKRLQKNTASPPTKSKLWQEQPVPVSPETSASSAANGESKTA